MKFFPLVASAATAVSATRYAVYFDQYHVTPTPNNTVTAGITHVITAFANSSLFTTTAYGNYTPFMNVSAVRAMFDPDTKVCLAIGGWGDTGGFGIGAENDTTRRYFADRVKQTMDNYTFDCIDVDWEYPGGNGADYRQIPNSKKTAEVDRFPKLLKEIKAAIGSKELSIAVPGLQRDMIAYTTETVPLIDATVDFVNVMTYDLMNRRDNFTTHHTSLNGSLEAIKTYLGMGMTASKMNLGFAFYAKYFTTAANVTCEGPVGCPTALLEAADGSDTGLSGAMTFEKSTFATVPTNLTETTDGTCGASVGLKCAATYCCSGSGYCGSTNDYCGSSCQVGYGNCNSNTSPAMQFQAVLKTPKYDSEAGGEWFWDANNTMFWTWDTTAIMAQKVDQIVKPLGLGGVMAWSLVEDSYDWSHLLQLQKSVRELASNRTGNGTRTGPVPSGKPFRLSGGSMKFTTVAHIEVS